MVVSKGTIVHIGAELPQSFSAVNVLKLPSVAILPGLVNAHCHLEFSDLNEPIARGDSFPDWIRRVIQYRMAAILTPEERLAARRNALAKGIVESYSAGVRWLIDMTTQPWDASWIQHGTESLTSNCSTLATMAWLPSSAPITIQPLIELIDISPQRRDQTIAFLNEQLSLSSHANIARIGIAPHATYTASTKLTEYAASLSAEQQRIVSVHIAESIEEMQWLESHAGAFHPLLSQLVADDYFETLGSITDRLSSLSHAWLALIAHGNYLSNDQLELLSQARNTMAIVHCPRTHAHFGHRHESSAIYPLQERIALGVRHLLGTDSRASNPDLNLWTEAQMLHATHPNVSSSTIVRMITTDAADLLIDGKDYGYLRLGSPAKLTAVRLASDSASQSASGVIAQEQIYDQLLSPQTTTRPLELEIDSRGHN